MFGSRNCKTYREVVPFHSRQLVFICCHPAFWAEPVGVHSEHIFIVVSYPGIHINFGLEIR